VSAYRRVAGGAPFEPEASRTLHIRKAFASPVAVGLRSRATGVARPEGVRFAGGGRLHSRATGVVCSERVRFPREG
jgi:hypothetical protein